MQAEISETDYNIVLWLVAPLCNLNVTEFINDTINGYINDDLDKFILCLKPNSTSYRLEKNINYYTHIRLEDKIIVIFHIPSVFKEDVKKISESKYSKLSKEAQDRIISLSGLSYVVFYTDKQGKIVKPDQISGRLGLDTYICCNRLIHTILNRQEYRLLLCDKIGIHLEEIQDLELYEKVQDCEIININDYINENKDRKQPLQLGRGC